MPVIDEDALDLWKPWWLKWSRRIECVGSASALRRRPGRRGRRLVRATDVSTAWFRLFMPAVDPEYVMPDWWLALTPDEKRARPRPSPVLRARRVAPASERSSGISFDDVGPYLKLRDGSIYRDRPTATHRLWRRLDHVPDLRRVLGWLPGRLGREGRAIRGRSSKRVLDALVCYSLVHAGETQIGAARHVLEWAGELEMNPKRLADENRAIWLELRLPVIA